METGTIVRLVADRGFGFIRRSNGDEIFFHASGVEGTTPFDNLREGQQVDALLNTLGPPWRATSLSPVTGNHERFVFLYDGDHVQEVEGGHFVRSPVASVFGRTPYQATFRAGPFDFTLVTVHLTYEDKEHRRRESEALAALAADVARESAEKDVIARWAAGGAPQGDPREIPQAPHFTEGWRIGTPDVVFEMQEDYAVPERGTIEYQYFYIPTNFTEAKWVQAIEVRPGRRDLVHHVLVQYQAPPDGPRAPAMLKLDREHNQLPPRQVGNRPPRRAEAPTRLLATYAPGTDPQVFRPGTALRLAPGQKISGRVVFESQRQTKPARASVGLRPMTSKGLTASSAPAALDPAGATMEINGVYDEIVGAWIKQYQVSSRLPLVVDGRVDRAPQQVAKTPRAHRFYTRNGFSLDGASHTEPFLGETLTEVRFVR